MKKVRLNFLIDEVYFIQFKNLCEKQGVTMSEMMRRLIDNYLKMFEDKDWIYFKGNFYKKTYIEDKKEVL